ncbi:MAG: hypothetical protein LBP68_04420 [Acidobacteriota bacterium]|jgi:hypothetical protein|nr:hypothetical protein [Acidobacteriota bacterium]
MRTKMVVLGILMALALATVAAAQPPVVKPACDRTCLEGYINKYLDAMLAHKVSPELFDKHVRFTENGVELPLGGEGLWYGMSGKGTYQFYIPDVETQQVAFIGTVKEGGQSAGAAEAKPAAPTTVAVAIRLKIVNGLITEAEQLAIRPEQSLTGAAPAPGPGAFPPTGEAVEKMGSPNPIFKEVIPEAQRQTREELVRIGNYYFAGLQRNDGKGYYPFTDDAVRFENGMMACGLDREGKLIPKACKQQFEHGLEGIVTRIRDRRFVAVDRERGIAFAFGFFDHVQINWTWQIAELFKIEGENIRRIEAIFHRSPYGLNSGWSTYEQGISEELQSIR